MIAIIVVIGLVALLAFANGANDSSKGVATLVGFGAAKPGQALLWATITTAVGAGLSFWLAGGLIAAFKSKLFVAGTPLETPFYIAVLVGAVGWIAFATLTGMPVSTTHAIVGGLIGAGLVAFGRGQIVWSFLTASVAVPLVLGPVVSLVLVYVLAWPVAAMNRRSAEKCVCVVECAEPAASPGEAVAARSLVTLTTGTTAECKAVSPTVAVTGAGVANAVHWASAGMVGFARGWNDTPKIAALSMVGLAAAKAQNPAAVGFVIVIVGMALGGLLGARKVLETLAKKLTPLPLAESLTASLTTAALVSAASWMAMPVSTTHVSTGAIVGAGLRNNPGAVKWGKVAEIAISWVVTLPVAGLIAAGTMWWLR